MVAVYLPDDAKYLEKQREEAAIKEGRPVETAEERERIWKLLVDAARG